MHYAILHLTSQAPWKPKRVILKDQKKRNLLISTAEAPCITQPHTPRNVLNVSHNRSLAFSHFVFHDGIFLCLKRDGIPAFPQHTPNALTAPLLQHDAKSLRLISAASPSAEILTVSCQLIHFCKILGVSYLWFLTDRVQTLLEGEREMDLRQTVKYIYKSSLSKIHFLRKIGKKGNTTHKKVTCFSFLHAFCFKPRYACTSLINGSHRFLAVKSLSLWSSNKQRFKSTICFWGTGLAYGGH